MRHPNIELIQRVYSAFMAGDREGVTGLLAPDILWHNSGFDPTAGTYRGVAEVLGYLMGENHMEDFALEVVDTLASDERVALVARSSGRRGDKTIVNDFVQVARIADGRVAEVWNYVWDQRGVAAFMSD